MSRFEMKLPDVGEGVAEAELVAWMVEVGDEVTPESSVAELLTDKSNVEISSPVSGTVVELHGEPGDVLAVGSNLIAIDTGGDLEPRPEVDTGGEPDAGAEAEPDSDSEPDPDLAASTSEDSLGRADEADSGPDATSRSGRAIASPAVRGRAAALGIDLSTMPGSGPDGRVEHADLDRVLTTNGSPGASRRRSAEGRVEAVRGVRRRIADRLSAAWSEIPHITYVEAIDATEVERLRAQLNAQAPDGAVRLTLLPFLARAIVVAAADQPSLNAHYDGPEEQLTIFDAVHIGVATQTDDGLRVPVVRHAEARGLRDLAGEITRVALAARDGSAMRDELTGSTITITSLGALGGVVTTPIINPPEVSIIGVNKMETRPVWGNGVFEPRQMFNLSSSFDHRIVDGWDAAIFVQRIKTLIETPALLFIDEG